MSAREPGALAILWTGLALLASGGCAPAAHSRTAEHPASSAAPVGPRVTLPVAGEDEVLGPALPEREPRDGHEHHHHGAPSPSSPPVDRAPAAGDHEGHARPGPAAAPGGHNAPPRPVAPTPPARPASSSPAPSPPAPSHKHKHNL